MEIDKNLQYDDPIKYLSILPPIYQSKPTSNRISEYSIQDKITELETKTKNLELANFRLVEIVFQLKNAIRNILSNSKEDTFYPNGIVQQIDHRLKKIENTRETKQISLGKEINLSESGLAQMSNRLLSMNNEMEVIQSEKNRLENTILKLVDEMIQLKNHFSIQGDVLSASTDQFNKKTKRLHDEYLNNLDSITEKMIYTQESARKFVNCSVVHDELREALEFVRHELKRMNFKLEEQTHGFTGSEANLAFRVSELAQKLNDEGRIRDVEIRRLDLAFHDTIHMQESTRMVLGNHLSGLLSESNSKQMDRETTIRLNLTQKIAEFDKLLLNEKETRNNREKEIHSRINEVMERAASYQNETLDEIKQTIMKNQNKSNEALHEIDSGMRLIEQAMEEKFRNCYKVTATEISSRKRLHDSMKSEIQMLEDQIRAATAAMQLAISGLANRIHDKSEIDEVKQITDKRICDFQLYMSRNFTDIDSQLQLMANQISNINLNVETRISQATNDLSTEVREALSSVMSWQSNSTAHLREMQAVRISLMQELAKMQLALNHIESEIPSQMTMETDERIQAIGDIRHQMESLKIAMNSQNNVKQVNVDQIHESIRKLAETLQSMKSTMGMKIQSEQEIRLSQINDLKTEMRYLEDQFMLKSKSATIGARHQNYIIKPSTDIEQVGNETPIVFIQLNHWSVYSIWRWTKFKEKLLLWKAKAIKNKGKKKTKFGGFKGFGKKSKK